MERRYEPRERRDRNDRGGRPQEQQRQDAKPAAEPKYQEHRAKTHERAADFLPHPETLEAYNYVIEGSAERIISMIEKEQRHRQELEARAINVMQTGLVFGQLLATAVAIAVIGATVTLGLKGESQLAAFIGVVGLAAMTAAFVKGRQLVVNQQRRAQKMRDGERRDGSGRPDQKKNTPPIF